MFVCWIRSLSFEWSRSHAFVGFFIHCTLGGKGTEGLGNGATNDRSNNRYFLYPGLISLPVLYHQNVARLYPSLERGYLLVDRALYSAAELIHGTELGELLKAGRSPDKGLSARLSNMSQQSAFGIAVTTLSKTACSKWGARRGPPTVLGVLDATATRGEPLSTCPGVLTTVSCSSSLRRWDSNIQKLGD